MGMEAWLIAVLGSGWLAAALAVRSIIRGSLIPRKTHEEAIAYRDKQIEMLAEDRDAWQEAHELAQRNYDILADKGNVSVELGQTSVEILRAIQRG